MLGYNYGVLFSQVYLRNRCLVTGDIGRVFQIQEKGLRLNRTVPNSTVPNRSVENRTGYLPAPRSAAAPSRPVIRYWLYTLMLIAFLVLAFGLVTRVSVAASAYDAAVPDAWFRLSLELVQETPGFTPPVASRAFGYLGVTLYETTQPGMWRHRSLAGQLNGLEQLPVPAFWPRYHWPTAVNAALAHKTRLLFPTASLAYQARIDELEYRFAQEFRQTVDARTFEQSVAWGRRVSETVYVWSTTDGGHAGYARNVDPDYVPIEGEAAWVSTPPAFARALQPTWGNNRPFVLPAGETCPASPPPDYSEAEDSAFYREAYEVYRLDWERTPEQYEIAVFWADEPGQTATPPGHWIAILNQVLAQEGATLDIAAEAYARSGMAVADSFITCWATKFQYNLLRPITYIQRVIDPAWYPDGVIANAMFTPPFPEYTSGHSVQSAAAAEVLTELFGEHYAFTDETHASRGLPPRHFASFHAAAQEAALSRLYGGIHFRSAVEDGLTQGRCVGEHVNALGFRR